LVGLDEERSLKKKVYTGDELLRRALDAAARIKREDQFRRTTSDLRRRVAKCSDVDGGILGHLSRIVTNSSFLCNKVFHSIMKLELKSTGSNFPSLSPTVLLLF